MVIFYILLGLLIGFGLRKRKANEPWCGKEASDAIKGVFICCVLINHSLSYIKPENVDIFVKMARLINGGIGQLMVVPFFFFSGYGVAEAIKKRGDEYVRDIPRKRILITLLNFDVAAIVYATLYFAYHGYVPLTRFLQSLVDWDTLGNSNWYIFVILICYLLTWIAFRVKHHVILICTLSVLCFSLTMSFLKEGIHWHNTMMAFPAGIIFSDKKALLESALKKGYVKWLLIFGISFLIFYIIPWRFRGIKYNIRGIFMALTIVTLMYRYEIKSRFLIWSGMSLFPLYLYHRLPMLILKRTSICEWPILFAALSFVVTGVIAYCFPKFQIKE